MRQSKPRVKREESDREFAPDRNDDDLVGELEMLAHSMICQCRGDDAAIIFMAIDRIKSYSASYQRAIELLAPPKKKASPNGSRDWDEVVLHDLFMYDQGSGDLLRRKIGRRGQERIAGSVGPNGYRTISHRGKAMLAHRAIWIMHNGPIRDGLEIDHIDGNTLNNRIDNLRLVNDTGQVRNRAMPITSTGDHLGVRRSYDDPRNWEASIGRRKIGSFGSYDEALANRKAAEEREGYHPNHGRVKPAAD